MLQPNHFFLRITVLTLKAQTQQARYATKLRKADKMFRKGSRYGGTLTQRLQRHVNGSLREPFRKLDKFVEHNSANELAQIGLLSESALFLRELTGRDYEVCHLHSLCRASEISRVNNVGNMAVLLKETNQIINRRCISRAHAEVLDRMVFGGNYLAARVFADQVCY